MLHKKQHCITMNWLLIQYSTISHTLTDRWSTSAFTQMQETARPHLSLYPRTEIAGMREAITEGLRVRVSTLFLPEKSYRLPGRSQFFYTYRSAILTSLFSRLSKAFNAILQRTLDPNCLLDEEQSNGACAATMALQEDPIVPLQGVCLYYYHDLFQLKEWICWTKILSSDWVWSCLKAPHTLRKYLWEDQHRFSVYTYHW